MSKIQVDVIEQQTACGTTLTAGGGAGKTVVVDATTVTLGRCGGTVALASGASQTGFGRTGTVDWQTTIKTGDFTSVSGEGYFANTTGSAFNMNLPAGVAGAIVSVADYAATWQTNAVTVSPNGTDKIGSLNENATLNIEGQSVTFVFVDSTQGWINTMDSTSNVRGATFICASVSGSGNTLTTAPCCANIKIATFTGPGNFTVSSIAGVAADNILSHMIIAGGGGGGSNYAGGGGAGGYREVKSPSSPYTASPLDGFSTPANRVTVTAQAYPIVIGGGGAAGSSGARGTTGSISTFGGLTSAGGGGGGSVSSNVAGIAGGSGGGNANDSNPVAAPSGNTPPVTPPQGNNGGRGRQPNSNNGSGGGGGATAVGATGFPIATPQGGGAAGGAGATSSINGTPTARAGGGGGGGQNTAPGGAAGTGGGGAGSGNASGPGSTPGTAGTVNTGGGGGGATCGTNTGGVGGSGIVIIRYRFQ